MKTQLHLRFRKIIILVAMGCICLSCTDNNEIIGPTGPELYLDSLYAVSNNDWVSFQYGPNPEQGVGILAASSATAKLRPLVIIVPGGGFSHLTIMEDFAFSFASRGYVVAYVSYTTYLKDITIVDERQYYTAVAKAMIDLRRAINQLLDDAESENPYRINPDRVFIAGYSAGAITTNHMIYYNELTDYSPLAQEVILDEAGSAGFEVLNHNVTGIINIAGTILDVEQIESNEPPIFNIYGENDDVIAQREGQQHLVGAVIDYNGPVNIYEQAQIQGITSGLFMKPGATHQDITNMDNEELEEALAEWLFKLL